MLQGDKGGHGCSGRGKKADLSGGTGGVDGHIAQQKARSHPKRAGRKGRAWEAFPWGKLMPRLDNFSSCFLCLSFVPPIHGRDSSETEGFVLLPACPNERGVSGLAVGRVCSHTMARGRASPGCSWETESKTEKGILCFLLNESFSKRTPGNTLCLWRC